MTTNTVKARRHSTLSIIAIAASLGLGSLTCHAADSDAQAYPSKPVRGIVSYPAGGVVDLVARAVTEQLAVDLKQAFVIEARPGASGNIGFSEALRAPADGYTLLMGVPNLATNPLLIPKTTKWQTADFVGVGLVGAPPNVFVVPASLPVRSMKEFVDYVRSQPGKLNVGNPGFGTSNHLGQELFFDLTGLKMNNVLYKGQPAIIPDLVSGQLSFNLMTIALARQMISEGKLRALAVNSPTRIADLPDVPTIGEAGYPAATFLPWYGFIARKGTPEPIVEKLSNAILLALQTPAVRQRLDKLGAVVTPAGAKDFDRLIADEVVRWGRLIDQRKIKLPD